MSTKINLLPWRETHRVETNKAFYINLGLCVAIAAGIGFFGFKVADGEVKHQERRNARLNTEIALLAEELKEIEELEETKNDLLARMEIINQLQGQRPLIVHTFHEVAERIPDGIFLTAMKQQGTERLELTGRADSNARISALMRGMDRSDYFDEPVLEIIEADKDGGISSFKIGVVQSAPKPEGSVEGEDKDGI